MVDNLTELLKRCKRGDQQAQSELYRLCHPVLMRIGLRYQSDEATAVALVNEGFFKILTRLDSLRPGVPFDTWMRRVMINTAIDHFRRNKTNFEKTEYRDFSVPETGRTENEFALNEADLRLDVEQLEAMIRSLPPVSREVFNLFAIDGYSHAEISDLLGMSAGTSKWHLSTARSRLQAMIKDYANAQKVQ